jgi:hypothetical protein
MERIAIQFAGGLGSIPDHRFGDFFNGYFPGRYFEIYLQSVLLLNLSLEI